ncbi:uncharacterized protein F4812DRAFT_123161 [Daldinia caldariorum]|uniref:uncharacterized protein n=1 Tax=Daldinia caldariorum TaxID=326644 RepID=UPI002007BD02|nr:uncharacterized protein F4812DRAFT_123161 [Daldinia caldariorum]KAI1465432.1 hypothetical protein F4812DRAFT_123161 [Daldinia caldariorum]
MAASFTRRQSAAATHTPCLITTALVIVSVIFLLLSLAATVLRFKARRLQRAKLLADDWWMLASWVLTLQPFINVWVFGSLTGLDYYKVDPFRGTTLSLQCLYAASILTLLALTAVKIAVLLFYNRVFATPKFRIAVRTLIVILVCWCITFIFLTALQGDPLDSPWQPGTGTFRYDIAAVGYAQVGSSIALDFLVLCFPLPVISRLRMAFTRKISVALIFWLGIFCCIASIVRLVFLVRLLSTVVEAKESIAIQSKQFVFLILEPHCSIIAGCLPCYGSLLASLGGRSPESLVRSVRSIVSLRSWGSRGSGGSQGNKDKITGSGLQVLSSANNGQTSHDESQVELTNKSQWPDSRHDVHVIASPKVDEVPEHTGNSENVQTDHGKNSINVTHGVDVSYV